MQPMTRWTMIMTIDALSLDPALRNSLADELCRRSLLAFHMRGFETGHPGQQLAMAPYLDAMCLQLERLYSGECSRLIITVPPRHGKSELASVSFPAWALGHNPSLKFMIVSYGLELSRLHAEKTRALVGSPDYRRIFPGTRVPRGKDKSHVFGTTAGGEWRAISAGGAVTGMGADFMIIDDMHKADEALTPVGRESAIQFYQNSLLSRFDDPANARIVVIQQRLHEDDIVGWLLERGGWHHLNLPAIAERDEAIPLTRGRVWHRKRDDLLDPNRVPRKFLEERRTELGSRIFSAQYQQDPITPEGNLLRWEWFGTYDERPERHEFLKVVQSWDTAMSSAPTSDFSVGTTWGFHRDERKWFLLDVFRQRLDFPHLKAAVIRLQRQWRADRVLLEDAGSGISLWQELAASGPFRPFMVKPKGSKEDRFSGSLAAVEEGYILLPSDAPWLQAFRSELKAFPLGRHDDQVDSFSQFIDHQRKNWRWVLTETDEDGRTIDVVRLDRRPW